MKHEHTIKTKPEDEVAITIECEGRSPISVTIIPSREGRRWIQVKAFDGGCGPVADPDPAALSVKGKR